jgi:transglutaminase-like putative cysteine protease
MLGALVPAAHAAEPRTRSFLFTYAASVTGLPPGKTVRIWLPVPPSNDEQQVKIVSRDLPGKGQTAREARYGNTILYVHAKADADGVVPLKIAYRVTRREVKADLKDHDADARLLALYLKPDSKVPITGKPLELIKDKKLPRDQLAAAQVLYDVVDDHMVYKKTGTGWGRGDAVWACENGYGNCTDFHSLFISLARSQKIPATFIIGFPLPPQRGSGAVAGYHCWAKFRPAGKGWVPVDISEANKNPKLRHYYFGNLSEDRVAFSTGRDLNLVPPQDGPPLNFFIYPYVEVGGKPHPAEKVKHKFAFKDEG